jgi:hypothetical protein
MTKMTNTKSPIEIRDIKARDCKRFGVVHPGEVRKGHHARIIPGVAIVLFGVATRYPYKRELGRAEPVTEGYCRRFEIGDLAEYHSYNLSFYGRIVAITAKRVVIEERHGNGSRQPKRHSLDIHTFSFRNYDWTPEAARKRNDSWSD